MFALNVVELVCLMEFAENRRRWQKSTTDEMQTLIKPNKVSAYLYYFNFQTFLEFVLFVFVLAEAIKNELRFNKYKFGLCELGKFLERFTKESKKR